MIFRLVSVRLGQRFEVVVEDVVAEFKQWKLSAAKTQRNVDEVADLFMKFGKGREKEPIHEILASDLET
jgi:hypothetical protein